jgi:hypothetical protein
MATRKRAAIRRSYPVSPMHINVVCTRTKPPDIPYKGIIMDNNLFHFLVCLFCFGFGFVFFGTN